MTDAAAAYAAMVDAYEAQRRSTAAAPAAGADRWSNAAERFRDDPRRPLDEVLEVLASYIEPGDVLLDVGGGAGRYGLPLALRCRELINVEPAAGMGAAFEASAREAGIGNARWLHADWLGAGDVEGDVSLVAHVTYFVRDIVPFLHKLDAASRRRVLILTSSTPPPNQGADVYEVVQGQPQALVPGYRQLLPVLWEAGFLPDVRVLSGRGARSTRLAGVPDLLPDREAAVASLLGDPLLDPSRREAARERIDAAFERLFAAVPGGYRRRGGPEPRLLLITWPTR